MGNSVVKQKLERAETSKVLSLEGCGLGFKDVNKHLAALKGLRSLDLSCNKLKGPVSQEIGAMTTLKKLTLDSNAITNGAVLQSLCDLEELSVRKNKLTELFPVAAMVKLKRLDVSFNCLTAFTIGDPAKFKALREVNLSHNALTAIPEGVFSLPQLTDADLSHNKLEGIDPASPMTCKNLQRINLSHNKITTLPASLFTDTKLNTLEIEHNPLQPSDLKNLDGYDHWLARQKKTIDKQISGGLAVEFINNQ